jgi:hypothetical protein
MVSAGRKAVGRGLKGIRSAQSVERLTASFTYIGPGNPEKAREFGVNVE